MGGRLRHVGLFRCRFEEEETPEALAVVALCDALNESMSGDQTEGKLDRLEDAKAEVEKHFRRGNRVHLTILLGIAEVKIRTMRKRFPHGITADGTGWAY